MGPGIPEALEAQTNAFSLPMNTPQSPSHCHNLSGCTNQVQMVRHDHVDQQGPEKQCLLGSPVGKESIPQLPKLRPPTIQYPKPNTKITISPPADHTMPQHACSCWMNQAEKTASKAQHGPPLGVWIVEVQNSGTQQRDTGQHLESPDTSFRKDTDGNETSKRIPMVMKIVNTEDLKK